MITVYRIDQLKRFVPFSYLNHSFILSLNDKVYIKFIVFLQISLCFFICQELCWMRGLCISFTSSCFLFPVGGGSIKLEDWGGWRLGLPIWGGYFCWGISTPLHAMTRACKQVKQHEIICLSCKICLILLSQNIWHKKSMTT